jgi:hypothetical protein
MPYPRQSLLLTPHGRMQMPERAIDGGSGQCLYLTIREGEGALVFFPEGVAFAPDVDMASPDHQWPYQEIGAYAVTSSAMLSLLKAVKARSSSS